MSSHMDTQPVKGSKQDSLTVIDNRDGKTHTFPITANTIKGSDLKKIGLKNYDPGYANTCAAKSKITYISGGEGILRYRGYPIEQLAEKSTFLEVAFLLIYGELPSKAQSQYFTEKVMRHTYVHEDLKTGMHASRYDAHPMGMLIGSMSAMSNVHPEANPALRGSGVYLSQEVRNKQMYRIIGTIATCSAFSYRHRIGRPYVAPAPPEMNLSYSENFLYMLDKMSHKNYHPHPRLARALDVLFILHADHELNCSTSAMRHLASSGVDVYTCIAGACGALYGPSHGGANEAVLRMLEGIGSVANVPAFIEKVKRKEVRLMGFGHRVYKNYDPRAKIIRKIADEVFSIVGREPLIEVATALEKAALTDEYFIKKNLYPNVDFYSGLIYKAMGFPTDFFPVLFAIPRAVGWLAHWNEFLDDKEQRIVRPFQIYQGSGERHWIPFDQRKTLAETKFHISESAESKRRNAGSSVLRSRL